jgi:hypothetical protein
LCVGMQSWKEKRGPAIKCNVTAGPETCQPQARADILARRPRVPDLQLQQLLTAPVDEALHSSHTA